jgi:hypothetical protein
MGGFRHCLVLTGADNRQIDVEEKGSLDKAAVIAALGQSGDADYDSVCPVHLTSMYPKGKIRTEQARRVRRRRMGQPRRTRHEKKELIIRLERLSRTLMSIHRDDWKLKIGYSCTHY